MPETMSSWLFGLFILLLMVWFETGAARWPGPLKFSQLIVVPSPSEALQPISAVIVTGGSSGIGKSFIELMGKLKPDLVFCNLSRRVPVIINIGERLNHFACDLSRPAEVERAARGVEDFLGRAVPAGQILLINNSGFGACGRFPAPRLSHQLEM